MKLSVRFYYPITYLSLNKFSLFYFFPVMAEYTKGAKKIVDDSSLMTYRGHTVLQTLIRCRFSPVHTTAQRYIYTGCASGSVYGK